MALRADCEAYYTIHKTCEEISPFTSELQKAMLVFLIDDLKDVTLDNLKEQRNRLMKMYHPDAIPDIDPKYAQKINSAYEVLKNHLV